MKPQSKQQRAAMLAFAAVVVAMIAFVIVLKNRTAPRFVWEGRVLRGTYTVVVEDREVNAGMKRVLDRNIPDFFMHMDALFSRDNGRGLVGDFNSSTSMMARLVGPEIWNVVNLQKQLAAVGGGNDITLVPLEDLWLRVKSGAIPAPPAEGLRGLLVGTGMDNIIAPGEGYIGKMRPAAKISLDAVAPGYIADRLAIFMRENGVKYYHATIGGTELSRTPPTEAQIVPIGPPAKAGEAPAATARLVQTQMATVGRNDGLIHINPQTGNLISNDIYSVSVIAQSGILANAIANSIYTLGAKAGLDWLATNGVVKGEAFVVASKPDGTFFTAKTRYFPVSTP
jgi:thiamine biosynthesis lipoprotein